MTTNLDSPIRTATKHRWRWGSLAFATLLVMGLLLRGPLARWGARALLEMLGADDIRLEVVQASPWRIELREVSFRVRTQAYAAGGVTIERAHWWTPSLGTLRIDRARVPVIVDGSDAKPWSWASYKNGPAKLQPLHLPVEEFLLDGQLIVQAAGVPEQAITVRGDVRWSGARLWSGKVQAAGNGFNLNGTVAANPVTDEVDFKLEGFSLELEQWQGFFHRLQLLPGGTARLTGQVTGQAQVRLGGKKILADGRLHLREGFYQNAARAVMAEGIEFDLEVADLASFRTKPGTFRVAKIRTGRLELRELEAGFAFENADTITVSRAALRVLGGRVAFEPFQYFLHRDALLEAVALVDRISLEEVLTLANSLPARATGRIDGRLPLRLDVAGLRLGTGWLALTDGVPAMVEFTAPGLLTGGLAANTPAYAVLKKIESGLLRLNVHQLRLDIHPPDAPPGRSAQLHLAGEPVDPGVKAPVSLDLNVNGPVEHLIDLGLDSRVSFGTKP